MPNKFQEVTQLYCIKFIEFIMRCIYRRRIRSVSEKIQQNRGKLAKRNSFSCASSDINYLIISRKGTRFASVVVRVLPPPVVLTGHIFFDSFGNVAKCLELLSIAVYLRVSVYSAAVAKMKYPREECRPFREIS